ncbi:MAG: HAD family hydrolase [Dysgonamonadaceae bacterium]|jgi:putative hydrolase of the HAD superfamily|nr:HAD family hydrolase [Dysgonamonadaceae bacterium]
MHEFSKVKGLIFDYGGTIDTNGIHWAEVIWNCYEKAGVLVEKQHFLDAYVEVERLLGSENLVKSNFSMKETLDLKLELQLKCLNKQGILPENTKTLSQFIAISNHCYNFASSILKKTKPVLRELTEVYPSALVSNFYGNLDAVINDFGISNYFAGVIESAKVGVRKPDCGIFAIAVEILGAKPSEIAVIGDSMKNDILPAQSLGCKTIWLKGKEFDSDSGSNTAADVVVTDFSDLKEIFLNKT